VTVSQVLARAGARRRLLRYCALAFAAVALVAAGCAQLAEKERELTFRVVPGDASWYAGLPDGVREMDIPLGAAGAQHLHAWWWPAGRADAPAVLYFHGSRWNLTGQLYRIRQLHEFGFAVLAVDYRGFGKSDGGVPSEASVYEDARAAWRRFAALVPDARRRIIYGHSLGGAVAVDLAAWLDAGHEGGGEPARGLVVESSFTTLADVAKSLSYSWLPVQWILSQKFDSLGKISQVRMPVLFVHGAADRFVPVRFSEALYQAATGPKKLLLIDGATHNYSMRSGASQYRHALAELFGLGAATPPKTSPPRRLGLSQ
jgi:fermentation-respiration switch protein FrsA (DUF1100 family)